MPSAATAPFAVEETFDGLCLTLPPRGTQRVPGVTFASWFLLLFGLVFAGLAAAMWLQAEGFGWLAAVPFLAAGVMTALLGLGLRRSHAVFELDRETLRTTEKLGLLRFRRRCARDSIRGVAVQNLQVRVNPGPVEGFGLLDIHGEHLVRAGFFYPVAVLEALAGRLRAELGLAEAGSEPASGGEGGAMPSLVQPPGSKVVLEPNAAGLLMTVPPLGFRGAARSLLLMGIVFVALPGSFGLGGLTTGSGSLLAGLFLGLLVLIGVALLFGARVMARRHALLAVANGSLLLRRVSPLGTFKHEWAPGQVTGVTVRDSGTTVNDRPLRQLWIESSGQPPVKLWAGRDEAELQWIAAVVRSALGLAPGAAL